MSDNNNQSSSNDNINESTSNVNTTKKELNQSNVLHEYFRDRYFDESNYRQHQKNDFYYLLLIFAAVCTVGIFEMGQRIITIPLSELKWVLGIFWILLVSFAVETVICMVLYISPQKMFVLPVYSKVISQKNEYELFLRREKVNDNNINQEIDSRVNRDIISFFGQCSEDLASKNKERMKVLRNIIKLSIVNISLVSIMYIIYFVYLFIVSF